LSQCLENTKPGLGYRVRNAAVIQEFLNYKTFLDRGTFEIELWDSQIKKTQFVQYIADRTVAS